MKAPVYSSVKWDSSLATCGVILKIKQEDIWKSLAQNRELIIVFFPSIPSWSLPFSKLPPQQMVHASHCPSKEIFSLDYSIKLPMAVQYSRSPGE